MYLLTQLTSKCILTSESASSEYRDQWTWKVKVIECSLANFCAKTLSLNGDIAMSVVEMQMCNANITSPQCTHVTSSHKIFHLQVVPKSWYGLKMSEICNAVFIMIMHVLAVVITSPCASPEEILTSSVLAVDRRSIRKCWEITRSRSAIYAP